ncbi:Small ribosomal subunit biogenesis GTPase RsgA [bioreactor metagenome]|uniref:Small ribosomal subunit biogenesis GTPase RsgA n=1 Tax=bioreactor metagenome TaxID=1076179 RepID=A0A644ZSN1_9ZZZZ
MSEGIILKVLSGFYDVFDGERTVICRARGKFRHQKVTPLAGDTARFTCLPDGSGVLEELLPRRNEFQRPAVANIDQLIIVASGAIPVTDPLLIDRMTSLAGRKGCGCVICINKWDLDQRQELYDIYAGAGYPTVPISAKTGEGVDRLRELLAGKTSVFTGNSGVGKSSILNLLEPGFCLQVGQVSDKLGRGRHTTRHVELYRLTFGATVGDTPGFSAFDADTGELCPKEELAQTFPEFVPYLDACRFTGCAHVKEKDCAVLAALSDGSISPSRHASYVRLYESAAARKDRTQK